MNYRTASLFASAALAAIAIPASAQQTAVDDRYDAQRVYAPTDTYSQSWEGEWQGERPYPGMWHGSYVDRDGRSVDAEYRGTFMGDLRFLTQDGTMLYRDGEFGWREDQYDRRYATGADWASPRGGPPPRQDGYRGDYSGSYQEYPPYQEPWSRADREAWLADCRAAYYDYDDEDRGEGGTIGSVLGAIIGGVAGNRIVDGERLAGTLIGAGVGGLAGAVIGAAIAASGDDDDDYGAEECEGYLAQQQAAWRNPAPAYGQGYHAQMAYAYPVMMIRVPIQREHRHRHTHGPECYEWVEEEVVFEEAPAPRIRREIPRQPTKLVPIK